MSKDVTKIIKPEPPARVKLDDKLKKLIESERSLLEIFVKNDDGNGFDTRIELLESKIRTTDIMARELGDFMKMAITRFDAEQALRKAAMDDLLETAKKQRVIIDAIRGAGAKLNRKRK